MNCTLYIIQVNPGSKAAKCGARDGDLISTINGQPTEGLTNVEVQKLIKRGGDRVSLELKSSSKRMGIHEGKNLRLHFSKTLREKKSTIIGSIQICSPYFILFVQIDFHQIF